MKKFYLFPFLLIMLTGCKYGSAVEAYKACKEWQAEKYQKGGWDLRLCKEDFGEQNRYIGLQWNGENKPSYDDYRYWYRSEYKVIKRFKY